MKKLLTLFLCLTVYCAYAQKDCNVIQNTNLPAGPDAVYSSSALQIQPKYPDGGIAGFKAFFKSKFNKKKIRDVKDESSIKVFVSFVIEKDGSISNIRILRSVSNDAGEQTVKVLEKMPKWSPGMQDGQPVRASMVLPLIIDFTE